MKNNYKFEYKLTLAELKELHAESMLRQQGGDSAIVDIRYSFMDCLIAVSRSVFFLGLAGVFLVCTLTLFGMVIFLPPPPGAVERSPSFYMMLIVVGIAPPVVVYASLLLWWAFATWRSLGKGGSSARVIIRLDSVDCTTMKTHVKFEISPQVHWHETRHTFELRDSITSTCKLEIPNMSICDQAEMVKLRRLMKLGAKLADK
jgi:hypothetical protein